MCKPLAAQVTGPYPGNRVIQPYRITMGMPWMGTPRASPGTWQPGGGKEGVGLTDGCRC